MGLLYIYRRGEARQLNTKFPDSIAVGFRIWSPFFHSASHGLSFIVPGSVGTGHHGGVGEVACSYAGRFFTLSSLIVAKAVLQSDLKSYKLSLESISLTLPMIP